MNKGKKRISKLLMFLLVMVFSLSLTAYAQETEKGDIQEDAAIEQADFKEDVDWESLGEPDQIVYGENNTSENARVSMSGILELSQQGTKLYGSYRTTYTYTVSKLGVKNVKLQYKNILGIWVTAVDIGERYATNTSAYGGGFATTGVVGRTYRLKGTHYVIVDGTTIEEDNATGTLKFVEP